MKYASVLGVLFNYALNCIFYTEVPGYILTIPNVFYIYTLEYFSKFEILIFNCLLDVGL